MKVEVVSSKWEGSVTVPSSSKNRGFIKMLVPPVSIILRFYPHRIMNIYTPSSHMVSDEADLSVSSPYHTGQQVMLSFVGGIYYRLTPIST